MKNEHDSAWGNADGDNMIGDIAAAVGGVALTKASKIANKGALLEFVSRGGGNTIRNIKRQEIATALGNRSGARAAAILTIRGDGSVYILPKRKLRKFSKKQQKEYLKYAKFFKQQEIDNIKAAAEMINDSVYDSADGSRMFILNDNGECL